MIMNLLPNEQSVLVLSSYGVPVKSSYLYIKDDLMIPNVLDE